MWFVRFRGPPEALHPALRPRACIAEDGSECCIYLDDEVDVEQVPFPLSVVRLGSILEIPRGKPEAICPWHYVVATDVQPDAEQDFNDWYDHEHLRGLASVPGVARASRYRIVEGAGPRYHACYDLADRSAFNGPAWLAVRATPWSDRVRPNFLNTRRTMYRRWMEQDS